MNITTSVPRRKRVLVQAPFPEPDNTKREIVSTEPEFGVPEVKGRNNKRAKKLVRNGDKIQEENKAWRTE